MVLDVSTSGDSEVTTTSSVNADVMTELEAQDAITGSNGDLQRAVDLHELAAPDGKSISLSYSLYHLATARATLGDVEAARGLLGRVVEIDTQIFGAQSAELADDLESLAELENTAGNPKEAERISRQAQTIRSTLPSPTSDGP